MTSQRIFQLILRRAIAPNVNGRPAGLMVQRRLAATQRVSHDEGAQILAKQRLKCPLSPHLSIIKPQITWIGSSLHRITGLTLSGPLYIFGIAYLVAPILDWHLDVQSMAAAVAAWPTIAKVSLKAFFAFPFFYHSFNGVRHLIWDVGIGFRKQTVITTGWSIVALTAVGGMYYTLTA